MALQQIRQYAIDESYQMRHYYLGVEHFFIALLMIQNGMGARLLAKHKLSPDYVIDHLRMKLGRGSRDGLVHQDQQTPRLDRVLNRARRRAQQENRREANEHDLWVELLQETNSMPIIVLRTLGIDPQELLNGPVPTGNTGPMTRVKITFTDQNYLLDSQQTRVITSMFQKYHAVRIERQLSGGHTSAVLYVVVPMDYDDHQDAPVVVKIDYKEDILEEWRRYEQHVRSAMPVFTAHIEDRVMPEGSDLAGLKYSLVADAQQQARDLRQILREWPPDQLGEWLYQRLFKSFERLWWSQAHPLRFPAWREYDALLPPLLTIEIVNDAQIPLDAPVIRGAVRRTTLNAIRLDDVVVIENYTVRKLRPKLKTMQVALGSASVPEMPYRIEVRGVDPQAHSFYHGEVIESLAGRVYSTRNEILLNAVHSLEPDVFEANDKYIPYSLDHNAKFINPLQRYNAELERQVSGQRSRIHGDMHLGNIMIGPNETAFLIDFARARKGHTVFDWAMLEISLLSELVMPTAGTTWNDARRVLHYINLINAGRHLPDDAEALTLAMAPVVEVRRIVKPLLHNPQVWAEYFVALGYNALRALTWEQTMSAASRRLMFLLAGLCFHELRERPEPGGTTRGEPTRPPGEDTDINPTVTI